LITQTTTTLAALNIALQLLRSGGILTIVVYPGHDGGQEEAEAVQAWATDIPSTLAQTVIYRFPQKEAAPYLIALHKR
jgi:endonuclease IV